MDQCTHEVRAEYWRNIIKACGQRPAGQSAKNIYTQELRADMAYQEVVTVDILNTETVKIEFLGSYGGVRYGMTDIYLVR